LNTLYSPSNNQENENFNNDARRNEINRITTRAFPNPSKKKVTVSFISEQDTYAIIEVYTPTGVLIDTIFEREITANRNYKANFNANGAMPSGVYIYMIRTNRGNITDRILLSE